MVREIVRSARRFVADVRPPRRRDGLKKRSWKLTS